MLEVPIGLLAVPLAFRWTPASEAEPAGSRFPSLCLHKLLLSSHFFFFFILLSFMAFSSLPHLRSLFMLAHPACLGCQMKCNLIDSLSYLELHSRNISVFPRGGGRKTGTRAQEGIEDSLAMFHLFLYEIWPLVS